LVNYFLKKFAQAQNQRPKSIDPEVIRVLERYHWPGNVRELENVIQRAIVVAKGEAILLNDLPPELLGAGQATVAAKESSAATRGPTPATGPDLAMLARTLFSWARQDGQFKVIPAVERQLIIEALAETKGNQVQAAKLLGITRATLRKRIEKF